MSSVVRSATVAVLAAAGLAISAAPALARTGQDGWSGGADTFTSRVFATGNDITQRIPGGRETISQPDDITYMDGRIYVGFQNGVGPQGQASSSGSTRSTIVAFDLSGRPVAKWSVVGKCDGLTADPQLDRVIATVNEDANSSVYLIDPDGAPTHYQYSEPLPHNGGTDAISIYDRMILISASAPGTTGTEPAPQPTFPAVYEATLDPQTRIATVTPLFYDEDAATVANTNAADFGQTVNLALTDPDSNEDVPYYADRFAGDFMLTSQGDQEQIFVQNAGTPWQRLSVLSLTSSVDDTAWPSDPYGTIYTTDNSDNSIYAIRGPFAPGQVFVADTPCDENSAPAICPAPGYPPNFVAELDPWTGVITPVTLAGPAPQAQGMLFLP
ncbi:MAG: hypothetical protein ACLP50_15675 [Solirubrobacteraceae bacterium]